MRSVGKVEIDADATAARYRLRPQQEVGGGSRVLGVAAVRQYLLVPPAMGKGDMMRRVRLCLMVAPGKMRGIDGRSPAY